MRGNAAYRQRRFANRNCGYGNVGGAEPGAGQNQGVARPAVRGLVMNVLPALHILMVTVATPIRQRQVFVAHNGVGTVGKHGTGHGFEAGIGARIGLLRLPGPLHSRHPKLPLPCGKCLIRNGDTIHRHPVEGRKITVGADGFAQGPAGSRIERHGFDTQIEQISLGNGKGVGDGQHDKCQLKAPKPPKGELLV